MNYLYELSDYLKSNCRSWENDCDNEEDTLALAAQLSVKFPDMPYDKIYEISKNWTGYESDLH